MGDIEMNFTDTVNPNVNVVFLCLGMVNPYYLKKEKLPVILKLSI
jgi:hypothetical protein